MYLNIVKAPNAAEVFGKSYGIKMPSFKPEGTA